jgi:hypothetical protein
MIRLFKVKEDEILQSELVTPEDIILVLNEQSKNLYLYRGKYCSNLNEFQSNILYERIINRFLNPNIYVIKTLVPSNDDSDEIKEIKQYILDHFPNLNHFELKRVMKKYFLLQDFRVNLKNFRNYQNSREWRSKLSNLTNTWRLTAFNILAIIAVGIILLFKILIDINSNNFLFLNPDGTLNSALWQLWLRNLEIILILCLIILTITLIINMIFIIFPLKFPITPNAIQSLSEPKAKSQDIQFKESILTPAIKTPVLPPSAGQKLPTKLSSPQLKISLTPKKEGFKVGESQSEFDMSDEDLNIPAPPIKKAIGPKVQDLAFDIPNMDEIAKKDTPELKHIVVEDTISKKNIIVPVPRKLVLDSKEPVVEISFITGTPQHVVAIQIDHDFQVRRRRASPALFETKSK